MNQSVFLILFVIGCCLDVVADVFFMNQLMGSRAVYYLGSGLTTIGGVGTVYFIIKKRPSKNKMR